jgi:hypothetical protein
MDLTGSLYDIFGVSEPLYLAIAGLVALLLAGSLSATVLEAARIYREYTAPVPPRKRPVATATPIQLPEKPEPAKLNITQLGDIAAQQAARQPAQPAKPAQPAPVASPVVPPVDVVKDNLPDSMKAITAKYGLDWLTIASGDGLVIASTSNTPDEDAAVYSNLFHELHRTRPEPYFNVSNKDIHLLRVESGAHAVIDVARKIGPMTQDEAAGVRDDSRKIVERFVWSAKTQK